MKSEETAVALAARTGAGQRVRPLRLGVVPYLNVAPVIHGLRGNADVLITSGVPSRIATELHAGELDLATLPVLEYAFGDYAIVPGIALASRGAVRSVILLHRLPLAEIRRVALDTSSRTSSALVRIVLRERLGRDLEYVPMAPDAEQMLGAADAALLIGDPALYCRAEARRLDLGDEWTRLTSLPFVYAFWAGAPGVATEGDVTMLQASLARGRRAIPEIAAAYKAQTPGIAATNLDYLTSCMSYDLGVSEIQGLREFFRRAHGLGLVPREPELRFHGAA